MMNLRKCLLHEWTRAEALVSTFRNKMKKGLLPGNIMSLTRATASRSETSVDKDTIISGALRWKFGEGSLSKYNPSEFSYN